MLALLELVSIKDSLKKGVIDRFSEDEYGFVGYQERNECFAISYSEDMDLLMPRIEECLPLYMIRGEKLASAFREKNPSYKEERYSEFIYLGSALDIEMYGYSKKTLDISFLDVVTESYNLADRDYVRSRLESGTVFGLFDQDSLMGFIGEHTEGAMGMLVVLPEYRRRGVGETMERLLINKILSEGRIPYLRCRCEEYQIPSSTGKTRDDKNRIGYILVLQNKLGSGNRFLAYLYNSSPNRTRYTAIS